MRYYKVVNFCLVTLFCFVSFKSDNDEKKIDYLRKKASPVITINVNDKGFTDLEYLKDKIGNCSIVMLGEDRHGDSITCEAKMRVVNYLSEELGFELLLIERKMYNTHKVMDGILQNETPLRALEKANYEVLYETDLNFWNFASKTIKKDSNFHIAGIDFFHDSTYIRELKSLLLKIDNNIINNERWKSFESYYSHFAITDRKILEKNFSVFLEDAKYVIHILNELAPNEIYNGEKINWWIRTIDNTIAQFNWLISAPPKSQSDREAEFFLLRDKEMANMVEWYSSYYKAKKIIISTSTYHISRNLNVLKTKNKSINNAKPMGDYLWQQNPNNIYSIAFISYSGMTTHNGGKDTPVPERKPNSIESLFHKAGLNYALLDLKNIDGNNEDAKWLKNAFIMQPTFNKEYNGKWSEIYDCLFYIDKMTSNNIRRINYYKN